MNTNDTNAKISWLFNKEAAFEAAEHWNDDIADLAEQEMLNIEVELFRATSNFEKRMLQDAYRWLDARHHAYMILKSRARAQQ